MLLHLKTKRKNRFLRLFSSATTVKFSNLNAEIAIVFLASYCNGIQFHSHRKWQTKYGHLVSYRYFFDWKLNKIEVKDISPLEKKSCLRTTFWLERCRLDISKKSFGHLSKFPELQCFFRVKCFVYQSIIYIISGNFIIIRNKGFPLWPAHIGLLNDVSLWASNFWSHL